MSDAARTAEGGSPDGRTVAMWAALALVVVCVVFGRGLAHEFVNWDDFIYVTQNELVTAPGQATALERLTTPVLGYPSPAPVLLYGWMWALGAGSPMLFHALNLALHLGCVLAVFMVLRRAGLLPPGAALIALGFGIHPLVVEPVAWVTGLKDVMMGLGVVLAWTWRDRPGRMLLGGLMALAAKPVAVTLGPGLLFALWLDRGAVTRPETQADAKTQAGTPTGPSARAWAVAGTITVAGVLLALYTSGAENESLRTTLDGGVQPGRMLAAAGLMVAHALVPLGLAPRYAPEMVAAGMMVLGLVALVTALLHLWRWTKQRDPRAGLVALSLLLYLPVSNIRPLVRFTADSYAYVPWMMVALIIGCTLASVPAWSRRVRLAAGGLALVWGAVSFAQVGVWKDSASLWGAAYEAQPQDGQSVYRYGDALGRAGESKQEIALYLSELEALQTAPKIPVALMVYLEQSGHANEAAGWYSLAFGRAEAQDDAVYRYYAEFVARNPQLHDPSHDDALAHAISVYLRMAAPQSLNPAQLERLRDEARRLGRPDLAMAL